VRAALTGHLVISTLHAGSCRGVLERLLVLCADRSAIASSVALILNHRLVRKLCRHCDGAGCAACLQTGYGGRVPVVEWLRADEKLRGQIRAHTLHEVATQHSLETSARELLQRGVTNETECRRVFGL
jgi:type II secretory ATPase GspE/PulE/Tfp pilus assembly ATPase PilB-like protein